MLSDMTALNIPGKSVNTSIFIGFYPPSPGPFPHKGGKGRKTPASFGSLMEVQNMQTLAYMVLRVCRKKAFFRLGSVKSKPQDLKKSSATLIAMIS